MVLSVGRTGQCWDKACVSHCTSWRGLCGNSVPDRASLAGDEARVAGCGRLDPSCVTSASSGMPSATMAVKTWRW